MLHIRAKKHRFAYMARIALDREDSLMVRENKQQMNFQGLNDELYGKAQALRREGESSADYLARLTKALGDEEARSSAIAALPGCEEEITFVSVHLAAVENAIVASCNRRISAIDEARASVQAELKSKDRSISDLQEALDRSKDEVASLKEVADHCDSLEKELGVLVRERDHLVDERASLQKAAEDAADREKDALAKSSLAFNDLAESRKAEQGLRSRISDLEEQSRLSIEGLKDGFHQEREKLESSRRDAERDLALAEQARENLSADLAKAEESLSSMTERAGRLEAKCDELAAQLSDARGREVDLEREVGRLNAELISANLAKKAEQKDGQKE